MTTGNRVLNRVLAALVGLVLLGGALLALAEIIVGLFGGDHLLVPKDRWLAGLRETTWAAGSVRLVATALVVLGLLLLVAGMTARARLLPMRAPKASITVTASARSLAQILRRQAETVPGVSGATAEVSARTARVTATVPLADPARVERELATVLGRSLSLIPWPQTPALRIEISSPRAARVAVTTPGPKQHPS